MPRGARPHKGRAGSRERNGDTLNLDKSRITS